MTGADLRSLIDEELRGLEPMASVVPDVLAEGRRRASRRRRLAVALVAATAIVVIGTVATLGGEDPTTSGPPTVAEPGTRAEFGPWAVERFDEVLPDRFTDLRSTGPGWDYGFVSQVDGRRIEFTFGIAYTKPPMHYTPKCDGPPYRPRHSCIERPGLDALAEHFVDGNDRGYAVLDREVGVGSKRVDLGLQFTAEPGHDVPISDARLLHIAQTPEFEEIWREYADHPRWWGRISGG